MLHLFLLGTLECAHALEHFVPVNECSVELGTVDAHELSLAADGQSASSAHTSAVYHDGVQAHVGRDVVLLSEQTRELHHYWRADGEGAVDVSLLLDELLYTHGHYAFLAVGAVVGHYDHLVGTLAHLVFHDYQVLAATGQHRQHAVAGCLQRLDDGQHRSHAHAATGTNHGSELLNVGGVAERSYHVGHIVALVEVAKLGGTQSHLLYYKRDGALAGVGFGYGERHTLAKLVNAHYHKVAGLAALGNQRSLYFEQKYLLGELLLADNLIHNVFFVIPELRCKGTIKRVKCKMFLHFRVLVPYINAQIGYNLLQFGPNFVICDVETAKRLDKCNRTERLSL